MFLNLLTENSTYRICLVSSAAGDVILLHFTVLLTSVAKNVMDEPVMRCQE